MPAGMNECVLTCTVPVVCYLLSGINLMAFYGYLMDIYGISFSIMTSFLLCGTIWFVGSSCISYWGFAGIQEVNHGMEATKHNKT